MKNNLLLTLLFVLFSTYIFAQIKVVAPNGDVGVGVDVPSQKLDVGGAIQLGNTENPEAGTIRWTGTDFEGYDGTKWISLTQGTTVGGCSTDADMDNVCADVDCDDNDASVGVRQLAGTSCDDGDENTVNDVIQSDGCTCAGVINTGGCSSEMNLATNGVATQSSTIYGGGAERAIDGNTNGVWSNGSISITGKDNNAWLEIDLGMSYNVAKIVMWNRTDGWSHRFSNFYLFVSDVPFNSKDLNTTRNQTNVNEYYFAGPEVNYEQLIGATGRYIRVQLDRQENLQIAEIQVFGCIIVDCATDADMDNVCADVDCDDNDASVGARQLVGTSCDDGDENTVNDVIQSDGCTCAGVINTGGCSSEMNLATNGVATQSSTIYGGGAERAIDGNTNGVWSNSSISITGKDNNAWLEIDLGMSYNVARIVMWNRTDGWSHRFSNFYLFVSDAPFNSKDLNTTRNQTNVNEYYFAGPEVNYEQLIGATGRYIRVQLDRQENLQIAEIQVFGCAVN